MYDADRRDRDVELGRELVRGLGDRTLLWVDLPDRDRDSVREIAGPLGLPDRTVEILAEEHAGARLIRHQDFIHVTVVAVEPVDDRLVRRSLDLIAGPNFVVSVHDGPIDAIDAFAENLQGDTLLGQLDGGSFLGALVDGIMSTWFARIEEIEREIDRLDEVAMRGPESEVFLVEVLRLRRRIALVRRTVAPHREVIAPLARPDFDLDERLGRPWPGLTDRLERVIDAAENARELLVGSFDIYLGGAAQRTNDVMKALTIVSAVLLPAIVLAGVMGMNFKLPFFDQTSNFWLVIGSMLVFAVGLLAFARIRRWI